MEDKKDWVVSKIADYDDAFRGSNVNIRKRITDDQLRRAFKKIFKHINSLNNIQQEIDKKEINIENHIVKNPLNGDQYQYYVTTYTKGSRYPWYRISEDRLTEIKNLVKGVICVFFEEDGGGSYLVYYKDWSLDEIISSPWNRSKSDETGKVGYRWSPQAKYKNYMKSVEESIR